MFEPPHFREDRFEAHDQLIRDYPLGLLITAGSGGLMANPIPFILRVKDGGRRVLQSHLARANPQWKELSAVSECLVVFHGPQAYVSPNWYPSKRDTGKVVPTWNYAMVQVRGRPMATEDASWLRTQIGSITDQKESAMPAPWSVADAPADYIASQIRGIVGLEIEVTQSVGKWKASQNRPEADRRGVHRALLDKSTGDGAMAALVAQFGKLET
jgi:transcriptional regulator